MKWKFKDWILFIFFGSISIYLLKDPLSISLKNIKNNFSKKETGLVDFTVRKNLNDILNSFYKDGIFYSCKYDNKSYYEGYGFTDDIDSLYIKEDPVWKYTIHDEIIFIDSGEKVGVKFSDLFPRFNYQHNFILERKDEEFYTVRSFSWTTGFGFDYYKEDYPNYLKENGDLNWESIYPLDNNVDPKLKDYYVDDSPITNFPSVTFRNNTLKVNFYYFDIYDFYKCTKFEFLSNLEKKELVKNFLDGFSRFEGFMERRERYDNKFKRFNSK